MPKPGFEFSLDSGVFNVTYNSPSRPVGNLREEFNNDAVSISKAGPVYIAFSSGVDSQIIARCFIDMKLDAEFVFLHLVGHNDIEYNRMLACEKFYGISVRKISLDINEYKAAWIEDNKKNAVNSIAQYPFVYLSSQLVEQWPMVTQGKMEPALVGVHKSKMAIYHNYYESMEVRFSLMSRHRQIYDFPYSPESVASYYTDDNMKTFASTIRYFANNNVMLNGNPVEYTQYFNTYAKPFVKGRYFGDDILWFSKLTGAEHYPDWLSGMGHVKDTRVSVPYWDLVDFLENSINESKTYNQWIFK